MMEVILLLVIIVLAVLLGYMEYSNRKERENMLNAIVARDNQELVNLKLADKTKIENKVEEPKEDLVETNDLSDEDYDKFVLGKETDNG